MLFHEQVFLFLFLPTALVGVLVLRRLSPKSALVWATLCSVFFYGFHGWEHVPLLLGSVVLNYLLGRSIENRRSGREGRTLLIAGIALNLLLLGIFKYADLLLATFSELTDGPALSSGIALPLAISFFTFQQIAYLVDLRKGKFSSPTFGRYCLFVTFFPQLIAGPIVRYQKILPQIVDGALGRLSRASAWTGLCLFSIGLFKKTCLADGIRPLADGIFAAARDGTTLSFAEAWAGATAFGLQIYFDFSAYSEMAIGLGLLFGLRLPLNFDSPYKALSFIDFWRRWHVTLSEFLRDYLYKPLGGNRAGVSQGMVNVFIVMALGGLWHGASWTFVAWGLCHGVLIASNHLLRAWENARFAELSNSLAGVCFRRLVTFACITLTWTFFRSPEFEQAFSLISSMLGLNGMDLPRFLGPPDAEGYLRFGGLLPNKVTDLGLLPFLLLLLALVAKLPNAMELVALDRDENQRIDMPTAKVVFLCGILFFFGLKVSFEAISHDFLYFRF